MAEFPALPLWTDAFLSDTMHLDATETGAYLLLLMTAWRRSNNDLPDNDVQLRRFARCSAKTWKTIRPRIMAFWELKDGTWRQKKLDSVRQTTRSRTAKQSNRAKARWTKPLKDNEPPHAAAMPRDASGISNQNQNQNHESQVTLPFALESAKDNGWPNDYRDVFWKTYPHKVGKAKALPKLDACRKRGIKWADIINGVKRYIDNKPVHQAWLNPETFFNQKRWEDEPALVQGGNHHGKAHDSVVASAARDVERLEGEIAAIQEEGTADQPKYPVHIQRLPRGSI